MIDDMASKGFGSNELRVNCPKCGHDFPLTQALAGEMKEELDRRLERERVKIRAEEESRVREEERKTFAEKMMDKEDQIKRLTSRVDQAIQNEIQTIALKRELELKQKELPLRIEEEVEKKRVDWEKKLEESYRNSYEAQMKKLNLTIEQQKKEVEDMKKRLEQGSQELQGEIQELMLEDTLRSAFPGDEINPVPKGSPGADIIQVVRNNYGERLGIIVWESKNTKSWSEKWIDKLRSDKEEAKGDFGVLISKVMPRDVKDFDVKKDVIVADYRLVNPIAYMLRNTIFQKHDLLRANQDRSGK